MVGNRHRPLPLVTVARSPVPRAVPTVLPPWEVRHDSPGSPRQPSPGAAGSSADASTPSKGSKFSLLRLDSSLSQSSGASQASSNASSRGSSRASSRGSSKSRSVRALTVAGTLAGAMAGCILKGPRGRRALGSRGGRSMWASEDEDDELEIPLEFTKAESPTERVSKRRAAQGRTKEDPMEYFYEEEEDQAWCCPAEIWCIVLSFVDTSDICRFACADCTFYACAMGYAGSDFTQPGWLRDKRTAVQERWARARAVLMQVQVVRGMRSATPPASGSVRRCPRLQRLNRHRR
mmetsp:Transcript_69027/g.173936  ORF Transcript_69027/g.173936 Transcript_69027/m.173936 type:complete len:292 (-) Transcript_69027:116-991(-)